jgi:hypothetical protein
MTTRADTSTLVIRASPLGRATSLSSIPPRDALVVLSSLVQARKRLILQSGFHAVYLITPPSPNIEPCWEVYERLLDSLLSEYPVRPPHATADWLIDSLISSLPRMSN